MLELSIILVNFNGKDYLEQCLKSLLSATQGLSSEIIVVDNASSDNSQEMIKTKFPQVKLLKNDRNIGFGAGNNLAIKIAKGKYQLFLNADTEIKDRGLLPNMIKWMDRHSKAGAASCALVNADDSSQATGGYFPTLTRIFAWMFFLDDLPILEHVITSYHPKVSFYKNEKQTDWLTGAFFLVRHEALKTTGNFDEDYFMYVEEVDLSYRLKHTGWQIWLVPQYKILHHGQAISGSEFAITQEFKGLKTFYKKHFPKWQMPVLKFFLRAGALMRIGIFGLLKGGKLAKTYVKAYRVV